MRAGGTVASVVASDRDGCNRCNGCQVCVSLRDWNDRDRSQRPPRRCVVGLTYRERKCEKGLQSAATSFSVELTGFGTGRRIPAAKGLRNAR